MVKTLISSKGQTTIPSQIRKRWKTSRILWESNPDGSAVVRPVPTARSLFGIAHDGKPRDPHEMEKARQAIGDDAAKKGPAR
jgi:bifunctional DNA-binding transcriptional regulator/antitoxin component of YhaV-PrlF toxin-antitoxin module